MGLTKGAGRVRAMFAAAIVLSLVGIAACRAEDTLPAVVSAPATVPSPTFVPSPWVTNVAAGNPPRSDQPLPPGIVNGDIVDCHLLWFIWENSKSRIWFPNVAPVEWFSQNPFYAGLSDGPEATGRLTGLLNTTHGWHIIATTVGDSQVIQQVYIVDEGKRIRYPIQHKKPTTAECSAIPTAVGTQYDPVFASP